MCRVLALRGVQIVEDGHFFVGHLLRFRSVFCRHAEQSAQRVAVPAIVRPGLICDVCTRLAVAVDVLIQRVIPAAGIVTVVIKQNVEVGALLSVGRALVLALFAKVFRAGQVGILVIFLPVQLLLQQIRRALRLSNLAVHGLGLRLQRLCLLAPLHQLIRPAAPGRYLVHQLLCLLLQRLLLLLQPLHIALRRRQVGVDGVLVRSDGLLPVVEQVLLLCAVGFIVLRRLLVLVPRRLIGGISGIHRFRRVFILFQRAGIFLLHLLHNPGRNSAAARVLLQLRQLSTQLVQLRIEIARRLIGVLQLLRLLFGVRLIGGHGVVFPLHIHAQLRLRIVFPIRRRAHEVVLIAAVLLLHGSGAVVLTLR